MGSHTYDPYSKDSQSRAAKFWKPPLATALSPEIGGVLKPGVIRAPERGSGRFWS